MRFILDTHVALWTTTEPGRLPAKVADLITDMRNSIVVSVASLWEVAIKRRVRPRDFDVDPRVLRRGFLDQGFDELPISPEHALAVVDLPTIHRDPFDRLLIAQATVEGMMLLTADAVVARYPGPIRKI